MARGLAAEDLNRTARAVEVPGEQSDHGLIRGGVHGRGGYFEAQFVAEWFADFISWRAGMYFDGKCHAVCLGGEECG